MATTDVPPRMLADRSASAGLRTAVIGLAGAVVLAAGCGTSSPRGVLRPQSDERTTRQTARYDRVIELRVEDQTTFWRDQGYVELFPTIPLPTSHDRRSSIRTVVRVPADARIDARFVPEQDRFVVVWPAGTRAARVEGLLYRVGEPALTISDVRGVWKADDERTWFFVLRPDGGEPETELVGWAWRRGEHIQHDAATTALLAHARTTKAPVDEPPYGPDALKRLREVNECASCHEHARPRQLFVGQDEPARRATDDLGLYVSSSVLTDSCAVANHRAEDLIDEDPFVSVHCGDRAAEPTPEGPAMYRCPEGLVPVARRDVGRALATGHDYTARVCASRRWFHARMTPRARETFRRGFQSCGITDVDVEVALEQDDRLEPRL